jgi:hypothetical protein
MAALRGDISFRYLKQFFLVFFIFINFNFNFIIQNYDFLYSAGTIFSGGEYQVKAQGPTKVITVRDTSPYGHAPTYQISLTYLERQKCYGPDKKILFKKQLFDLEGKGQAPTKVITVRDTPPYGHAHTNHLSMKFC